MPACEEAGILGALTGIIGSIQAMEVMKEILGIGDSLAGRLLMYDALEARMLMAEIRWIGTTPSTARGRGSAICRTMPEGYWAASGSSSMSPDRRSSGRGVEMML